MSENFALRHRATGVYRLECKDCYNASKQTAYRLSPEKREQQKQAQLQLKARNKQFVWDYLRNHPCVDCGETDIVVLEFDHVRGEKYKNVSLIAGCSSGLQTLISEIEKCEVVCANCHRKRTAMRSGWAKAAYGTS